MGVHLIVEKFKNEKKVLETSESRNPSSLFAQLLAASQTTEQIPVAQFRNILVSSVDSNSVEKIVTDLQNKDGLIGKLLIEESDTNRHTGIFSADEQVTSISVHLPTG